MPWLGNNFGRLVPLISSRSGLEGLRNDLGFSGWLCCAKLTKFITEVHTGNSAWKHPKHTLVVLLLQYLQTKLSRNT